MDADEKEQFAHGVSREKTALGILTKFPEAMRYSPCEATQVIYAVCV